MKSLTNVLYNLYIQFSFALALYKEGESERAAVISNRQSSIKIEQDAKGKAKVTIHLYSGDDMVLAADQIEHTVLRAVEMYRTTLHNLRSRGFEVLGIEEVSKEI